jgi:hypothetical protein
MSRDWVILLFFVAQTSRTLAIHKTWLFLKQFEITFKDLFMLLMDRQEGTF